MIRAVLFDLGETLITSNDIYDTYKQIMKEKGIDAELDAIGKAHQEATEEFLAREKKPRKTKYQDFNDIYAEWNQSVVEKMGIRNKGLGKYISQRWFDVCGLREYDDSAPVLSRLSAMGLRIGLVTNGFEKEAQTVLDKIDGQIKSNLFEVIVGRDTAGASKPDPRPFIHAAGTLGLRPDEVLFVGDSFHNDYEGSQGAGMRPVLILRGRQPPADAPDDITTIQTLDEVMNFI